MSDEPSVDLTGARLLRTDRLKASLGAFFAAAGLALTLAPGLGMEAKVAGFVTYALGLGYFGLTFSRVASFARDARSLTLKGSRLELDGVPFIAREEVRQAFIQPGPKGTTLVRLSRRGWSRKSSPVIEVASEEQGLALLRALGVDAPQSLTTYRFDDALVVSRLAFLFACVGLVASHLAITAGFIFQPGYRPLLAVAGVLVMGLFIWRFGGRSKIEVGPDAVLIAWLGKKRRVLLSEIERVDNAPHHLRLLLRSGESIDLTIAGRPASEAKRRRDLEHLRSTPALELERAGARIAESLAALRRREETEPHLPLEAQGRSAEAWLSSLRQMGRSAQPGQGEYRGQAVMAERLWRIVEDPASAPEARAGAAVALSETIDAPGRQRLRIAASITALPGVRGVIERAADEEADAAALAEALEELSREEERATFGSSRTQRSTSGQTPG